MIKWLLVIIAAADVVLGAASCGGTSGCGLQLVQSLYLPAPIKNPATNEYEQRDAPVPCCGGFVVQPIDLSNAGDVEVDLSNPAPTGSGIDGFLANDNCGQLFSPPYPGGRAQCTIQLGPVPPRQVSQRRKIPPARYRLIAQAYDTNLAAVPVSLELGIWSTKCRWNPIAQ